ncbi:TM0106 family RecB-like putative nuclease [Herbiconiux sp. CPCC 203407]|uniref:TM0106 family RecB-like putative nuclease n=1 Tax=Herbiconiux oxytropis TaxID=2970915 RepID=A0AA41XDK6_9MICO|nr:TM0106 family RecB-like putative nuclease [Herbiconiux oxytropis]MCS5721312.1 TM0106 family RecB-like putative nuclease [Herbiconiux oxytropis]MCS5726249.1 TM0106 family RecB-like putative nuclease [Herbiconiux oxytropis]
MILTGGTVLYSATDLTAAASCEFALVRRLDAKLGRVAPPPESTDEMLERTARLGDAHELRTLERFRAEFGPFVAESAVGVAEIDRPERTTPEALADQQEVTLEALRAGADVVFQGTFFDGRFLGFADFLVKAGQASAGPVYEVYDTKLARHAKITALLQLAAYADQLERLGVPTGPEVHLLLGDGSRSTHQLRDILPVYRDRRERLEALLDDRSREGVAPAAWGDERYTACGRCDVCAPEVEAHDDVLLVAGLRLGQRERLRAAGLPTLTAFASSTGPVEGLADTTLAALREQAAMQVQGRSGLAYRVFAPAALGALPPPDPADIFFDFEGDPLYTENAGPEWGLDYLFGVIEHEASAHTSSGSSAPDAGLLGLPQPGGIDPRTVFRPFWAHDHAEEREALRAFLDYLTERLHEHPGLHVYHYADYERAHLQSLCARHGVGEEQLDELLRRGVLVDLYPIVKKSLRVSTRSYSLKKLEPLYMGDLLRDSGVTNAADSITAYARWAELRDEGEAEAAATLLGEIADYNEYDCVSTLRLRDWLLDRAAENGLDPSVAAPAPHLDALGGDGGPGPHGTAGSGTDGSVGPDGFTFAASPVHEALSAFLDRVDAGEEPGIDGDDRTAIALAAAAIDYHRREDKSFWWEHYGRLERPLEEWSDTRDVLEVTHTRVDREWYREGRQKADRREIRLRGVLAPGSRLEPGASGRFFVYDPPHPWPDPRARATDRLAHARTTLDEVLELENGLTQFVFTEALRVGDLPYDAVPIAVAPSAPPKTDSLQAAISEWGATLAAALPEFPADPALDLLRRRPPRTLRPSVAVDSAPPTSTTLRPVGDGPRGTIDAIRDSLLDLDHSFLAVQGPPGTGKTYTGARVVADLVREHGWRVGVVAQSHAVVENMLDAIVGAGVDPAAVGKSSDSPAARFTALSGRDALGRFLAHAERHDAGAVIGGTAWDFTNTGRVGRRSLDLLVIDEAGQFSLANTIAVSVAARNLLLLGDPQQLPQVTQGTHPEPVDSSALGWLTDGHDVLPHHLGYFLDVSWRMHPEVCAPVSDLSYEGELHSKLPATTDRRLEGVEPGLHLEPVQHIGNSTQSPDEAALVARIVRGLLGLTWHDPGEEPPGRPIEASDIIVVAPYNAQVELVRQTLAESGLDGVSVGTVDKFQGREAAVAIVTLAASSAAEVPRGIGFLLMKNRLNVAISRAKWAAYLVYSPALVDHLPGNAAELATLSGFLRLTRAVPTDRAPAG